MDVSRYFSFHQAELSGGAATGNGYLSFLPSDCGRQLSNGLQYRFYELDFAVLLEVWGTVAEGDSGIYLLGEEIALWQLFQFAGESLIYLPHSLKLGEHRCLPLATKRSKVAIRWRCQDVRLFVVGYRRAALPLLIDEYRSLHHNLWDFVNDNQTLDVLLPDIGINNKLRQVFLDMSQLRYRPFGTRIDLGKLLLALFDELDDEIQRSMQSGARSQLRIYYQALAYIKEHFMEDITKESIAESLCISSRTLSRAFEGRPIKIADYIQRLKLNKARDLLDGGNMTVEEVAYELGFSNRKYFSREFKKYFFQSPSSFRRK